jgi:hypothetical protein
MYRRRFSPYSNISEIRESRGELIALAVTTVVLGILLNILAAVLYERIVLGQPFSELRLVGFIVGLASALLIIGFMAHV